MSSPPWGAELVERFTKVFHLFDVNADGVIDRDEYALLLDRIAKGKDVPKGVRLAPPGLPEL